MPSPYVTYTLAALSIGLGVAFVRVSDENSELNRAKMAVEMTLETAQGEAKAFRDKYDSESRAREFAEAAQTLAETSERAAHNQLAHETKAREAAEKSLAEAETSRKAAEAALLDAQEQLRVVNAKLMDANAAKNLSELKTDTSAKEAGSEAKDPATPSAESTPAPKAAPAQASMGGGRSWFSFLGF